MTPHCALGQGGSVRLTVVLTVLRGGELGGSDCSSWRRSRGGSDYAPWKSWGGPGRAPWGGAGWAWPCSVHCVAVICGRSGAQCFCFLNRRSVIFVCISCFSDSTASLIMVVVCSAVLRACGGTGTSALAACCPPDTDPHTETAEASLTLEHMPWGSQPVPPLHYRGGESDSSSHSTCY